MVDKDDDEGCEAAIQGKKFLAKIVTSRGAGNSKMDIMVQLNSGLSFWGNFR